MQQRRDQPQVTRDRGLQRKQRQHALIDLEVAAVDAVVVRDHQGAELHVLLLKRLRHAFHLPHDDTQRVKRRVLQRPKFLAISRTPHRPDRPVADAG